MGGEGSLKLVRTWTEADEAFWRRFGLAEDDPRRNGRIWAGSGYRWFQSPNVIPIEHWQRFELDDPCPATKRFEP
jgi:hypothetical protein